ncbi:hypothetical protein ABZ783_25055 [Micromonospora sp. NPDC047738]|uniref:hypothetical protein n=1 Tax=Micromonospora sp. NPDC047738 TaxID=3155741 RepID=UPI0033DFAF75
MALLAWWDPGWYNLDQSLRVGRRDTFAFFWPGDMAVDDPRIGFDRHPHRLLLTKPGYDLVFANSVGRAWDYRSATVESIEHARFGPLDAVDTTSFGQYTFRLHDGRSVTIEAEETPGAVNAASPDFPVDVCDPAWAGNSGWALVVVLADVTEASPDRT